MPAKKDVVVVGGSSGSDVAKLLSTKLSASQHNLTLIEALPYRVFLPATLRMAVSSKDKLEDQILLPYDRLFENGIGSVKQGVVSGVHPAKSGKGGEVELQSGERVHYDVLLLATGSAWDGPIGFPYKEGEEAVSEFIQNGREKFANAHNIVLAGGGAVGIELAGELRDAFPTKSITIVQGFSRLLNKVYPPKVSKALETKLKARNVDLVFNDYIDGIPSGEYNSVTTRNGKIIPADLVVSTRGATANTSYLNSEASPCLSPNTLSPSTKRVVVRSTFQLPSPHDDIFAIGDMTDIDEQKQVGKNITHISIVTENILCYLGVKQGKMKEYKTSMEAILITVGRDGGLLYVDKFGGITMGDWVARNLKSRDLMVPKMRKMVGY